MEKIEDIRILQVDGLHGGGGEGGSGSPTDEVINSALRYRVQAPMIDSLLADIGIEGGNLAKRAGLIREARDMQRIGERMPKKAQAARTAAARRSAERSPSTEGKSVMARVYVSTVINARRDRVWARVRDFNGLPNWHPAHRGEPDRERRACGQGRLRARLSPAQRRPHPRKAARAVRLRHVLHLLDPGIADAADRTTSRPCG